MASLSCRISPFTSTVIFLDRSPVAIAVATSAMLCTWPVRLLAIKFTLSVRSFHVPATSGTSAWPPSFPSVPTSRATRVTSPAKALSWSTMVLMVFFSSRISPFTSTVILRDKSPRATAVVTSAMLRTCGADLARDARHFGREGAELLHHRVQGVLEQQDLAAHVHRDLLREVAAGNGGGDLGDVADLCGEVRRHEVDVVGEVLPGAGDFRHFGLAAELAFGADLARDARHFGGERVELVHHGVDGVLELEDLTAHVDRDLARQVTA